jgi:hypothetical protein
VSARDRDNLPGEAEGGEPSSPGPKPAATTPAEKRYGSPLAQALADKGVTKPTAGDAAQAAVDKKSGGAPVDSGVRAAVEPHVGADLGGVRVHSDPLSQQSTAAMGARAFAHGGDVFLGPGESATDVGLMAHELTHVVQQGAAGEKGAQRKLEVGAANSPAEQQADAVAGAVVGGAAPQQLIVDDSAPVADGQMNRTAFMAALRPKVMAAAEEELGFIRAVVGCPYIEKYFNLYGQRDARTIESAARKFAPGARTAKSANEMIAPIVAQVREGVRAWVKDGSLIGPAAELDPSGAAAAKQSFDETNKGAAQTKPAAPSAKPTIDLEQDAARSLGATAGAMAAPAADARSPVAIRDRLGDGQPIDAGVAQRMGDAMGQSFSDVRIHTDDKAAMLTRQEDARAFAVGNQVAFAPGEYQPGTPRGDALLAHELAHVGQMRGASPDSAMAKSADTAQSPAHEADADQAAVGVMGRLWGGVKSVGDRVGPALTSGFGLRRCGGKKEAADDSASAVVKPGAAKLPPHVHVTFGEDMFRLGFGESGEGDKRAFDVKVDYTGPHPTDSHLSVGGKSVTLSQPVKQKELTIDAAVKDIHPNAVNIDIFKNDYDIVKLSDKISFDDTRKARKHDFKGQLFGVTGGEATLWVKDPKAKPLPPDRDGPAIQDDVPGEASKVYRYEKGGNKFQVRLDLDGDQQKETLLEITLIDRYENGSGKTFEYTFTQLSTGSKVTAPQMVMKESKTPFDRPYVDANVPNSDGFIPTEVLWTGGKGTPNYAYHVSLLKIAPPTLVADKQMYSLSHYDGWATTLTMPKDPEGPKKHNTASDLVKTASFFSSELSIGPYKDKFRMVIEPGFYDMFARLGIAPLERADPKATLTAYLRLPPDLKPKVLAHEGVAIQIDLDGDGKPDIEIFSRIQDPLYGGGSPEQARDLILRLRGPAMAQETGMGYSLREGVWTVGDLGNSRDTAIEAEVGDVHAAAAVHGAASLKEQAKLPTYDEQFDAWDSMMQMERAKAVKEKLITPELYQAWFDLHMALVKLRPQMRANQADSSKPVDTGMRDAAAAAAEKLHKEVQANSGGMKVVAEYDAEWDSESTTNHFVQEKDKYTGEEKMTVDSEKTDKVVYQLPGYGPAVAGNLRAGKWTDALRSYNAQVHGFDTWILDQMLKKPDADKHAIKRLKYLSGMRYEVGKLEGKSGLTPVFGTFHPSADYKPWEGGVTQVPLSLFYWEENSKWHLKDLHNPAEMLGDVEVDKGSEDKPPHALFEKLNHRKRFPRGVIHYQIPGGRGDKVTTTEEKKWHDYLQEIAMVVAVIGLAISAVATAGTSLAVFGGYVLTASAIAGGVAAAGDIADQADHGVLDGTTLAIDVLQIASAVFSTAAIGFGKVIMRGAAAEAPGASAAAKAAAPPKWLQSMAGQWYLPMRGAGLAADGVQLLIVTDMAFKQLEALKNSSGSPEDIERAKRQIITMLAIQGGFFALSLKGEIPTLAKGMDLGITMVGKNPVAHVEAHLDPNTIKFSQENIGATTSDGLKIADLKTSMMTEGWKGEPIHVVELPDGSLVSLDNRRLMAAREAVAAGGLKGADGNPTTTIPTKLHHHTEPMAADWAAAGFVAEKNVYKLADGTLTTTKPHDGAEPVIKKGHVAQTYGEAATIRTANQGKIKEGPNAGKPFPIGGNMDPPRVREPKPAAGTDAPPKGNDVDASAKPSLDTIDPNNDAARIQTKSINDAISNGETKLDWAKKSADGTTTLGAEYKKWIEGPDPVDFSGKSPKANYNGHPEFKGDIDAIVAKGNITLNLKAAAGGKAVADLKLASLDPASPTYATDRAVLVEKFGPDAVKAYEAAKLGDASDPTRAKVYDQVNKVVGPDAITRLRNAFPDCEIYITGSTSQPGKDVGKIADLDVVLVVPDGVDGVGRAAYEAKAKLLSVPTTPEFAAATGKNSLPLDASARTKEDAFGLITAKTPEGRTPLQYARVDANTPANSAEARTVLWAKGLADGATPAQKDPAKLEADAKAYEARREDIKKLYEDVMSGKIDPPPGVTREQLKLAVEGDASGERIPLTFPDAKTFHEFQADLRAALSRAGITDATVQQVGSATMGWKGNPEKPLGPFNALGQPGVKPSDADMAVFSLQGLEQARQIGAVANPKVAMGGELTVVWNNPKDGAPAFAKTPLGQELDALAKRWTKRLYGSEGADGFDFKLNLTTEPFSGAITVVSP